MLSPAYVSAALGAAHVVVVEDSVFMQNLLTAMLRALGVGRVTRVPNAEKARETLQNQDVDVVFIDWLLEGGEDGCSLLKSIRTGERGPLARVPVIACTAYTDRARVEALRDAGVHEVLVKPVSPANLFDRLVAALFSAREFIYADAYIGPDRRRRDRPIEFDDRRRTGMAQVDIDDLFG